MWESGKADETVMIPVIPSDVMAEHMAEETEAERLAKMRQRGITIGMAIVLAGLMVCAAGCGMGAFLTRVLVL